MYRAVFGAENINAAIFEIGDTEQMDIDQIDVDQIDVDQIDLETAEGTLCLTEQA